MCPVYPVPPPPTFTGLLWFVHHNLRPNSKKSTARNRLRTYSTRPLQVRKVWDPRFLEQRMLVNHIESWEIPEQNDHQTIERTSCYWDQNLLDNISTLCNLFRILTKSIGITTSTRRTERSLGERPIVVKEEKTRGKIIHLLRRPPNPADLKA